MDEIKFSTFALATGTAEIEQGVGVKGGQNFKRSNNLTATTDPTVNAGTSLLYTKGSIWINQTLGRFWVCQDPAEGAAVWKCLSQDNGFQNITLTNNGTIQLATATGFVSAGGTGSVNDATIKLPASPYLGKTVQVSVLYPIGNSLTISNSLSTSQEIFGIVTNWFNATFVCTDAALETWAYVGYNVA